MPQSLPDPRREPDREQQAARRGGAPGEERFGAVQDRLLGASALPGRSKSIRYLLLLRFGVVNLVAVALLLAALGQGWIGLIVAADPTGLTYLIVGVFVLGWAICAAKIVRTSRELNRAKEFDVFAPTSSQALAYLASVKGRSPESRAISAQALRMKFASRLAVIRQIANSLVFLGLIGTVIGFIIALSGVEPNAVSDVRNVAPMVSTLIQGMSVALYTTLIGAVLNIWLLTNYRILATGSVSLVNAIVELGEAHART